MDGAAPTGTERVVVEVERGRASAVAEELTDLGIEPYERLETVTEGFAVEVDPAEARALHEIPGVDVHPERRFSVGATPVTARTVRPSAVGRQADPVWNLDRLDQATGPLDGVYRYPASAGRGVRVYVIDTGVAAGHPELGGRTERGYNVYGGPPDDCHGHGTHVAGTVASTTYGVAKRAVVVPVRVTDCLGEATAADLLAGFEWILATHRPGTPGVVNISLSGEREPLVDAAVDLLLDAGLFVTVAAGNRGVDACRFSPARAPGAFTVGATTSADARLAGTNVGTCLDGFAPGGEVRSLSHLSRRGSTVASGTSMAAPHVAGLAAIHLAERPTARPGDITAVLSRDSVPGVHSRGAASPDLLVTLPGPGPERSKARLAGEDRYATAVAVGEEAFPDSDEVVIVAGATASLVDGLVAAPFAVHREAPVLLSERYRLGSVTRREVRERRPEIAWLVGGTGVMSGSVTRELRDLGIEVRRLAGADRYGTAAAVASRMPRGRAAVVASGAPGNLVDAAAAAGPAAADGRPILLTAPRQLPPVTRAALRERQVTEVRVLGGTGAVSPRVVEQLRGMGLPTARVGGADRYATAAAVASRFRDATGTDVVVVTGGADVNLVDAVTGGVLRRPTLLTRRDAPGPTRDWIVRHDVRHVVAVGGTGVVPSQTLELLRALP